MNKLAIKKWDELEDRVPAHAIVADDNCAQVEVGCQAHNHFDVAGATGIEDHRSLAIVNARSKANWAR